MTKRIRILLMVAFAMLVLMGSVTVYGYSIPKTVKVVYGSKTNFYNTTADTVKELFDEANIEITENDIVTPSLSSEIKNGEEIVVRRASNVTFKYADKEKTVSTNASTVEDLVKEYKNLFGEGYAISSPEPTARITNNMVINIDVYSERIDSRTETVPFEIKYEEDSTLEKGVQKVVQEGKNGTAEIKVKFVYFGDTLKSREEYSKEIIEEPIDHIIKVGTKEEVKTETAATQAAGNIAGYNYSKTISMVSTAYTPYDAGCSGVTSTGMTAKKGVAAIDPRVIPYGTKLYIPGYGEAVAGDCGGAIKGNRIDLCYSSLSEAYSWGRRNVTVYILE